jgi:hypothetical protein
VSSSVPSILEAKGHQLKLDAMRRAAIDRLLSEGIRIGPASKRRAISKALHDFPEVNRGYCWQRIRHLKKTPELAARQACPPGERTPRARRADTAARPAPRRRWTPEEDDKLLNSAGYESVKRIAQQLSRSPRAVRYRLCALGMSAKVQDGWSLRRLRKQLKVSPTRLRQFIARGLLGVRDPRVTADSLLALCERQRDSLDPMMVKKIKAAKTKAKAYTQERVASLLGVALAQVQTWIADGHLHLADLYVSDRSFEQFCRKHGDQINLALMSPRMAKWLIEGYGVPAPAADPARVGRAQKHALVVRACACGRKIAGNVYFKHLKACRVADSQAMSEAA